MVYQTTQQNQTQEFDPIQFETEREEIFNRTEVDRSSPKFHTYSEDFSSGSWDALIGADPEDHQLFSADYIAGYLHGTRERLEKRLAELRQSAA